MPGAVPAIVTGITGLGGALIQSGGNKRAAQYQAQANNQALQLERERDAEARRRYDQQWEMQMAQARLRDQVARQILSQHGINVPGGAAAAPAVSGKSGGYSGSGPSVPGATPASNGTSLDGFRSSLLALSPGMTSGTVEGPPAGPVAGAVGGGGIASATPMFDSQGGGQMPASSLGGLTNWSDELWRKQ